MLSGSLPTSKQGVGGRERERERREKKTVQFVILCTTSMYQGLDGPLSLYTQCWQDGAQAAGCFVCKTQKKKDHGKLMGI